MRHAPGDLRRVIAARLQAFQQHVERGGFDEDADDIARQCRADLPVALPVNIEQHVARLLKHRFHRARGVP